MAKNNSDFYKKKKIWSEVKDELLSCYLVPYFVKMIYKGDPILYVDCFAGKGKFDDGTNGSPLIALNAFNRSVKISNENRRKCNPQIHMYFIELIHANDLMNNIPKQISNFCTVIKGEFENNIIPLFQEFRRKFNHLSVFLYIDPYGIKSLKTELLCDLPESFNSTEILLNLNSFGFIREACRVMNVVFRENEKEILGDLFEYDDTQLDTLEKLNTIAGDNYWQNIILDYKEKKIDCYKAEQVFSKKFKAYLNKKYKYVLDMPIRLKSGNHPKYRMIYATNHPDGCVLMADNISRRTDKLVIDVQRGGQLSFFPETTDNDFINDSLLKEKVCNLLKEKNDFTRLNEILADFYNENDVICNSKKLCSGKKGSIFKELENDGLIQVKREPKFNKKSKPTKFWQENGYNKVYLKWS